MELGPANKGSGMGFLNVLNFFFCITFRLTALLCGQTQLSAGADKAISRDLRG